jgi:hypothetical protein
MFYHIKFFVFITFYYWKLKTLFEYELTLLQVLFLSRTIQQLKAQVEGIKQERSKVST